MSGFETGVAVMPHVRGDAGDTEDDPRGRIRGTQRLLTTAALIMSVFLITSSFVTTLLIPPPSSRPAARPTAARWPTSRTSTSATPSARSYDVSTIAILWFAGASAMAGLLNLIPRYLPRYGMAPDWAGAVRPLVLVLTGIAFLVTWIFDADVDAQGGAYATGVLVLITSAAVAVTLAARRARPARLDDRRSRVDHRGLRLHDRRQRRRAPGRREDRRLLHRWRSSWSRCVSRLAPRLRAARDHDVVLDDTSRVVRPRLRPPHDPAGRQRARRRATPQEYADKIAPDPARPRPARTTRTSIFVEVTVTDPSDFEAELDVRGEVLHGRYRVLTIESSSVPNALAALLLHVRDVTGRAPRTSTSSGPRATRSRNFLRFLLFGQGEVAPVTREVLRRAEPDPTPAPARACRMMERGGEPIALRLAEPAGGCRLAAGGRRHRRADRGAAARHRGPAPSFEAMLYLVLAVALRPGRRPVAGARRAPSSACSR